MFFLNNMWAWVIDKWMCLESCVMTVVYMSVSVQAIALLKFVPSVITDWVWIDNELCDIYSKYRLSFMSSTAGAVFAKFGLWADTSDVVNLAEFLWLVGGFHSTRGWSKFAFLLRDWLSPLTLCFYCDHMWAWEYCWINPPHFLAKCCKRRLNQASFVLLCFVLFAFSGLCLVCVLSVFNLSCVLYFPAWTNMNDTV